MVSLVKKVEEQLHTLHLTEVENPLFVAIRTKNTSAIKEQVRRGVHLTTKNEEGLSAFACIEAAFGLPFAESLLFIYPIDESSLLDLFRTLFRGQYIQAAQIMLERVAKEAPLWWGQSQLAVFILAVQSGDKAAATTLLPIENANFFESCVHWEEIGKLFGGMEPLAQKIIEKLRVYTPSVKKVIITCIEKQHTELAIALIKHIQSLQPKMKPIWWNTVELFHVAGVYNNSTVAKKLLPEIIQSTDEEIKIRTLIIASEKRWEDVVEQLLMQASNPQALINRTSWNYLVAGCPKSAKQLIETIPLHSKFAALFASLLVDKGDKAYIALFFSRITALAESQKPKWWQDMNFHMHCLSFAGQNKDEELFRVFLQRVDVNFVGTDIGNLTPLMVAGYAGFSSLVRELVTRKAKLYTQDDVGVTAWEYIYKQCSSELALELFEAAISDLSNREAYSLLLVLINRKIQLAADVTVKLFMTQASERPKWWNSINATNLCLVMLNTFPKYETKIFPESTTEGCWWADPVCRSRLLAKALLCPEIKPLQRFCTAEGVEPNYLYDDKPLLLVALQAHKDDIVIALVLKGVRLSDRYAHLYLLEHIEMYSTKLAEKVLKIWPLKHAETPLLIYTLFLFNEIQARKMLEAVKKDTSCTWWSNPNEKAIVFCGAARANCIDVVRSLASDIGVHVFDAQGKTPLEYAAELSEYKVVETLVKRGSNMRYAMRALLTHFEGSSVSALIDLCSLENEETGQLLLDLYNMHQGKYAAQLLARTKKRSKSIRWFQNPKYIHKLFFAICRLLRMDSTLKTDRYAYVNHVREITDLAGRVNCFAVDAFHQTALMHVVGLRCEALIKFFVQQGASLVHTAHFAVANAENTYVERSAFALVNQEFPSYARTLIEKDFQIQSTELGALLVTLVQEGFYDKALILFRRAAARKSELQLWKKGEKTLLFLRVIASKMTESEKQECIEVLLPEVEPYKKDVQGLHRTPLMAASFYACGEAVCEVLLRKSSFSSLMQKDVEQKSAFQYILEHKAISLSNTVLQQVLAHFYVTTEMIRTSATHEALLTYIKGAIHEARSVPLHAKVALCMLFNDTQRTKAYCSALSFEALMDLFKQLKVCYGNECAALCMNCAYESNEAHFNGRQDQEVPPKNKNTSVATLLSLYKNYALEQDEKELMLLQQLVTRIEEKRALFTKNSSDPLVPVYVRIDNALCYTINMFEEILAKSAHPSDTVVRKIRSFLHDMVAAAGNCGWRLHTHAVEQYFNYVKNRSRTLADLFLQSLFMSRMYLVESCIDSSEQSVHIYNAFHRLFGKALDLPGANAITSYDDPYADGHEASAVEAKRRFDEGYTARFIFETIRASFEESGAKDLYLAYLKSRYSATQGDARATAQVTRVLTAIAEDTHLDTQGKQKKIREFLDKHSIAVSNTTSVEAILKELNEVATKEPGWLFLAMEQELEGERIRFTDESLLQTLLELNILRPKKA